MQSNIINYKQPTRRELNYFVYMIRVWSDSEQDANAIRLTAENTRTGQRTGFTSWEELVQYLQKHTIEPAALH